MEWARLGLSGVIYLRTLAYLDTAVWQSLRLQPLSLCVRPQNLKKTKKTACCCKTS